MKNIPIVALMAAAGLVGCGGGGGSGNAAPTVAPPTVTISAANQGSVARTTVDGGQAFGQSQPFAATDGTTAQSVAPARAVPRNGVLQSAVRRGLAAAFAPQRTAIATAARPAAAATTTDACAVSGSTTTAIVDADGSQSLSNGDSLTITFNQCNDADAVMNGVMTFTLANVSSTAADNVRFGGTLAFTQVSATSSTGSSSINGSVGVAVALTPTSFQLALTVGGGALTVVNSAAGYLDTIVYEQGMQLTVTATDGAVSQSTVTLDGSFTAASIGGRILVATVQPLRQLDTDAYPSSGQVVVTGAAGTHLRVTALSASQVQLELDANGDGSYEGSGVFAWGTL